MRMQNTTHECEQWQTAIDLYFDHATTLKFTDQDILLEIEKCPVCKNYYLNQMAYKQKLHECKDAMRCSATIKNNVLSAIRGLV